jgi:nucleoside-diphosphate-sugar epimerase
VARQSVLHIILGAGGSVGRPLAQDLLDQGLRVRTVSRRGAGVGDAEGVRADLMDAGSVEHAIDEGATAYLLVGLPYDRRVWRDMWPRIMRNVVLACESKRARLIFFDNVYVYGRVEGPMTEQTPVRPCSAKGAIRAQIAGYLEQEMSAGRITALIARAADFYGPYSDQTSVPSILVLQKLAAGKRAQVLVDRNTRHSYTYTLDCASALRLLAAEEDVFGQVWHLPTARPALTGHQFVELAAQVLGVPPRMMVVPRWTVQAAGIVSTLMRELAEMLYQNDQDYIFDSSKFERRFGFVPTAYEDGIRTTARQFAQMRASGGS